VEVGPAPSARKHKANLTPHGRYRATYSSSIVNLAAKIPPSPAQQGPTTGLLQATRAYPGREKKGNPTRQVFKDMQQQSWPPRIEKSQSRAMLCPGPLGFYSKMVQEV